MAELKFDVLLESRQFLEDMKKVQASFKETEERVKKSGLSIEQFYDNLKSAAVAAAAGFSAKQFISEVVRVRGAFQQLEVAFQTMLGSEEKALDLMQQLTKTAAITPFDLQGVTQGAKQLLAYGIAAEDVNDTLIHLGDIAAGLSLPLNDLVYLYGTTMTQGRMFTQDLRQFMGRGIPIAEELAKQFGVTKDKVAELVTAGKVGAKEFNQAIMAMSSEGGKFAGLMEAQSKTITGQISNIEDALDSMFNNIGKQSEGIINGTLSVVSSLVENYQRVGEVIGGVVATYGVYKAAVMTVAAAQALQTAGIGALTTAETVHYSWLVLCEKAQKLLNATLLANPYVLAATALAGLVAIMVTMKSQQDLVNEAMEDYNRKKEEAIANEQKHMDKLNELIRIAGDESLSSDTRREAMLKLKAEYPDLFKKYNTEIEALKDIAFWKAKIAEIESGKSITNPVNELGSVNRSIAELEKKGAARYNTVTTQSGSLLTTQIGGRTQKEEAQLLDLKQRRDKLTKTIKKNKTDNYLANLTGVSNEDLERQIEERRELIARIEMQEVEGKKNLKGRVKQGGATGIYDKSELQDQLQTMEWEQNRRKQIVEDGGKDFIAEARKAYNAEKAELDKLRALSNPSKRAKSSLTIELNGKEVKVSDMSAEQYADAIKKQQESVDEAEKKMKALTGKSDSKADKDARERAKQQARRVADELKYADELADIKQQASDAQKDADLAAISDNAERERKERELQHERTLRDLEDQEDDIYKAIYEQRKKEWEATHKDSPYESTAPGAAGWGSDVMAGTLSEKEKEYYDTRMAVIKAHKEQENAVWARAEEERYSEERQRLRDYIKEYGSIQDQRAAITAEYDEKIAKTSDEIQRATLEREKERLLKELDTKALNIDWETAFNDLDKVSVQYLEGLRDKLRALLNNGRIDADNAKVISERLLEVENRISDKRNVWASLIPALKERERLARAAAKAEDDYNRAKDEQIKKQDKLNDLLLEVNSLYGTNIGGEQLSTMSEQQFLKLLGLDGLDANPQAVKDATAEFYKLKAASTDLGEAMEKATKAGEENAKSQNILKNFGNGFKANWKEAVKQAGGEAMGTANVVASNIQDLPRLMEDLHLENTEFGLAVGKFAEGTNHFMSAIQNYQSGNYVGAVADFIEGVLSFGGMFGGADNHEEMLKLQEEYNHSLDSSSRALEKFTSELEKSYGVMAIENAKNADEIIRKNMQTIVNGIDSVLSDNYGGGHSDYYHANKNQDVLQQLQVYGSRYGMNFNEGGQYTWQQVLRNDPEKLAQMFEELSESGEDLWRVITGELGYNGGALEEWLEKLIDTYKQLGENEERLKEQLTTTTADDVFNNFMDSLYGLADGSEDVFEDIADNWQKMVNKMVLNNIVGAKYKKQLQDWYDNILAKTYEDGISTEEYLQRLNVAKAEYDKIVQAGATEIDILKQAGFDPSSSSYTQSATSRSFQAKSQETADELSGRFTALQLSGENIAQQMIATVERLTSLNSFFEGSGSGAIGEIRNLCFNIDMNTASIAEHTEKIFKDMKGKLDTIIKNTSYLA